MGWGHAATAGRASTGRTSGAERARSFARDCSTRNVVARPSQEPDIDIAGAVARGDIQPIYCLSGERYLVDAAATAIRTAVLAAAGAGAAFNNDVFDLKESGIGAAIATA